MWLDVHVLAPEYPSCSVTRDVLGYIDEFTASVIALTGIAFGILVSQNRTHRFQYPLRDKILRSYHLEIVSEPAFFVGDCCGNLRINLSKRLVHRHSHIVPLSRFACRIEYREYQT